MTVTVATNAFEKFCKYVHFKIIPLITGVVKKFDNVLESTCKFSVVSKKKNIYLKMGNTLY